MVGFIVGVVFGVVLLLVVSLGAVVANEERWDERWLKHPPDDDDGCREDKEDQEVSHGSK